MILYSQPANPWFASGPTFVTNIDAGSQPAAFVTRGLRRASTSPASAVPAATLQRRRPILIELAFRETERAAISVRVLPTTIICTVGGLAAAAVAVAASGAATASRAPMATRPLIGP